MKDPLQTGKTAYEILGIGQDALKKDIDQAFKKCFASGVNINDVTNARNTLNKSVERGLTDILHYNDNFISTLDFMKMNPINALTSQRPGTADALLTFQKAEFPCSAGDHTISVFWYWWAVYSEECKLAGNSLGYEIPVPRFSIGQFWLGAIANWGHVIMSDEFWNDWINSSPVIRSYLAAPDDLSALKQKLQNHFLALFSSYTEKYRMHGDNESAEKFRQYESKFKKEISVAADFIKLGFTIKHRNRQFPINFGKHLMESLDYLNLLNDTLKSSTLTEPENIKIKDGLLHDLSPYAFIRQMLERNEIDKVIDTISQYDTATKENTELEEILARAFMAKGNTGFDSGHYKESLDNWKKANHKKIIEKDLEEAICSRCKRKIHSYFAEDFTAADSFMEKVFKIIDSAELKMIYSEILFQKSIAEIVAIQKKTRTDTTLSENDIRKLELEVAQLEKAANYGSINAKNNLTNAKNFLGELKSGLIGLPVESIELLNQANQESNEGNWDKSVALIEKAIKKTSNQTHHLAMEKILAQTYNAKAVSMINQFMSFINPMMEFHRIHLDEMIDAFMSGNDPMRVFSKSSIIEKKKKSKGSAIIVYLLIGSFFIPLILSWIGIIKLGTVIETIMCLIIILMPQIISAITSISSWFSPPKLNLYNPYGYNYSRPNCKLCNNYSDYTYDLPGYGSVNLCSNHSNSLKKIYEWTPPVDNHQKQLITEAESALSSAVGLIPAGDELTNTVRENQKVIRDIRDRFKF